MLAADSGEDPFVDVDPLFPTMNQVPEATMQFFRATVARMKDVPY